MKGSGNESNGLKKSEKKDSWQADIGGNRIGIVVGKFDLPGLYV